MGQRNPPANSGTDHTEPEEVEDWIAGHLRKVRREALREEIPERMRALLDQLDRLERSENSEEEDPP